MRPARFLPAILLVMLPQSFALAAPKPVVATQFLADTAVVQPAKPFTVAIVVTPPPSWHIYWKNPGDAGTATQFAFHLPPGFTADAVRFPLPTSFSQPGNISAYGYTGRTVFLATITPPKDLPAGPSQISVDVSWLCCDEICVPGSAKLSLTLPAADPKNAPDAAKDLIKKAKALLPADTLPAGTTAATLAAPAVGLTLQWPGTPPALQIFPLALQGLEVSDIHIDTAKNTTSIKLTARLLAGAKLPAEQLPILITYTDPGGVRHGFYQNVDLRPLAQDKNK